MVHLSTIHRSQIRPIDQQPQVINNIFAIVPNEQILKRYMYEQGGCGCGPTFNVILTDSRLIERRQDNACCGTGPRNDKMLFLSDISTITDAVVGKSCNPCSCSCYSSCCAGTGRKEIAFIGPFGTQVFTFNLTDIPDALLHIPAAAMPHKTSKSRF
jgi:hypothetical protein